MRHAITSATLPISGAAKDLVYRLYREEGLGLRTRPRGRRRAVVHRQERFKPIGPNLVWAMDFGAP